MSYETDTVFSGIPDKDAKGNNTYRYSGAHSKYKSDGSQKRWNGSTWVDMGGGRKSRRNARSRRNSKKSKRVRHTRRKQTRRHRHSRRR